MQTLFVEGNEPVLIELQRNNPEIQISALYRRRKIVQSLIRALERYQRATARPIPGCRGPQAA